LLAAFENTLIPQRLQAYGLSPGEAMSAYGRITGMALPLIYFPSAFLVSLAISLVPAVSEARAVKNHGHIHRTVSRSLLFCAVIGFCAAGIFVAFARELGLVIYRQNLAGMLTVLGVMCPLLYTQMVLSGVLNGLGFQMFIFQNSLIASAISIACVYFFVPRWGVNGFIFGWFLSLAVVCVLEMDKLRGAMDLRLQFANWLLKPLLAAAAAGLALRPLAARLLLPRLGGPVGLAVAVAAFVALYLALTALTGCLSKEDFQGLRESLRLK
jgi:stage V sporulation protein B